MRVLALSWFDPASVVLSHRNLMRAVGHDFRLAVVRAYTERQQQADWVCERLVRTQEQVAPGVTKAQAYYEKLNPDLEALREFASQADVIQFHPGIGHGDGDWASAEGTLEHPRMECLGVADILGIGRDFLYSKRATPFVYFVHGSRSVWASRARFLEDFKPLTREFFAASTIDYAYELDAAYLPPLIEVDQYTYTSVTSAGRPLGNFESRTMAEKAHPGMAIVETPIGYLRAKLRGDDDPLLIAHTPTDRIACSTEEFLKAAQGLGIPVRLGEGLNHSDVLRLKAECNAGFDHLRGAFSVNTLENAAIGLVPLFALKPQYRDHLTTNGIVPPTDFHEADDLRHVLRALNESPHMTRAYQRIARTWWEQYFSADPTTQRLLKLYESL